MRRCLLLATTSVALFALAGPSRVAAEGPVDATVDAAVSTTASTSSMPPPCPAIRWAWEGRFEAHSAATGSVRVTVDSVKSTVKHEEAVHETSYNATGTFQWSPGSSTLVSEVSGTKLTSNNLEEPWNDTLRLTDPSCDDTGRVVSFKANGTEVTRQ